MKSAPAAQNTAPGLGAPGEEALAGFFRGKGILVTGAAGYLGTNLVALLRQVDCRIVRLDRPGVAWEPVHGAARVTNRCADIRDPSVWEESLAGIDVIFHFAAQTSAYAADSDPVADQASNVQPLLHLLEACRRRGTRPTLCFSSTVTVAGIPQRLPVDEGHPDHPLTVYDLHKLMAEQYLRWYAEQGAVRGVTLRLANVYGPGPRSSSSDRGVLNQMMRRALAGEALTVYGAGDQLRDYVYVADVARAFLAAARHAEALNGEHFVIGSGVGHSIAGAMELVADCVREHSGASVAVRHVESPHPPSPIEGRHFVADSRRFSRITGWQAHYPLAAGIKKSLEAFS